MNIERNRFESLIGFKMTKILFRPTNGITAPNNMFELIFEKGNKNFSLNVFCLLRIMMNNSILLTSSDEFVDTNYHLIGSEASEQVSIVYKNIVNVQQKSCNVKVTQATLKECGDVLIRLSNNIIIEIIIDCAADGLEYYRLSDNDNGNNLIVAETVKGQIHFDYTGGRTSQKNDP